MQTFIRDYRAELKSKLRIMKIGCKSEKIYLENVILNLK